jgi:uncharacterized membrane protein YhaH (DUF805 family)
MSSYPPPPAYQPPPEKPAGEPPIWAPWYGIGFVPAIKRFFQKYADFSGRASRSEFWWLILAYGIVYIALSIISGLTTVGTVMDAQNGVAATGPSAGYIVVLVIEIIIGLAIIVPLLALYWRRLHDTNLAGPFFFLGFIPIVGSIIVLVLVIRASDPQGQRFDRPRP